MAATPTTQLIQSCAWPWLQAKCFTVGDAVEAMQERLVKGFEPRSSKAQQKGRQTPFWWLYTSCLRIKKVVQSREPRTSALYFHSCTFRGCPLWFRRFSTNQNFSSCSIRLLSSFRPCSSAYPLLCTYSLVTHLQAASSLLT